MEKGGLEAREGRTAAEGGGHRYRGEWEGGGRNGGVLTLIGGAYVSHRDSEWHILAHG